jgi:hypothetical protein
MGEVVSTQMCLGAMGVVCRKGLKQENRKRERARMRVGYAINLY